MAHCQRRSRPMTTGLLLAALLVLGQGCGSIPQRNWQSYPHLTSDPTFRKWLIIKCTVEDDATVPPGLDQTIGFFFTVAGVATGNMIDYYSDVSYGAASFVGTTIVGWYPAPFKTTTTLKRRERALACANAIPDSDANDIPFEDYYGIVMMTNRLVDGGACYDAQQSLQIKDKSYNLACVSFDPESLFITFCRPRDGTRPRDAALLRQHARQLWRLSRRVLRQVGHHERPERLHLQGDELRHATAPTQHSGDRPRCAEPAADGMDSPTAASRPTPSALPIPTSR